jgi:ribonuclease VapC
MSAVNYSETLQKLARLGIERDFIEEAVNDFEIVIASLSQPLARLAADFYRHGSGLSFADRACLATAKVFAASAYTADKKWLDYGSEFGVDVIDIRQV